MENFNFCVGTRILFGKGQEEKLPELLRPYGNKVLLTYGGGSIKRTGLYDRIKNLLHEFEIFELGGIEPNPRIESVYAGCGNLQRRRHRCDPCSRRRKYAGLFQSHCRRSLL